MNLNDEKHIEHEGDKPQGGLLWVLAIVSFLGMATCAVGYMIACWCK